MSPRSIKGLLVLNGLLVASVAAITFSPTADAQQRYRGKYAMVAGRAQGSSPYILYIVDQNSRQLVAVRYDASKRILEGMGYADLAADGVVARQGGK